MAKDKKQKQDIINDYEKKLNEASALIVITPTAITPNEANELRKKLHKVKSNFTVIKNTLFKIASQKAKRDLSNIDLGGENAVIFCSQDASQSAKILHEFFDEIEKGEILGGLLENSPISAQQVEELAKLPSREILIANTVGTIAAPLSSFSYALKFNIMSLINTLKNISEKNT